MSSPRIMSPIVLSGPGDVNEPRAREPPNPRTPEPANPRTREPANPRTREPASHILSRGACQQRRVLGSTWFEISTIGRGTWAIGGHMWGRQDDAQSAEAIHAALDHGINWIDTAPIYGSGHSEEVVGRAVKELPASRRPLVFTKFGLGIDSDSPNRSASAAEVQAECEGSLRRLGVDAIDLYQLHWPAPQPIAETAAACEQLLKAGKIRAVGVSNFSVAQLEEWQATGVPLHSVQPPYSILRPAVKQDVLPWCATHDVGAISYSPLF